MSEQRLRAIGVSGNCLMSEAKLLSVAGRAEKRACQDGRSNPSCTLETPAVTQIAEKRQHHTVIILSVCLPGARLCPNYIIKRSMS